MSKRAIFQELCAKCEDIIQFIPFVHAFNAFVSPLIFNHYDYEDHVIINLPSIMGTHQNDPMGGALFTLTHFKTLHSTTSHFPSYLFSSIIDHIHIISSPSIMSYTYEHFQIELHAINLIIQL
jgi:hypothetical protein